LPVLGHHLVAGPGDALTVLLQTSEYDRIAAIHDSAAKARNVPRASIVLVRGLRRCTESGQNKRKNKKQPLHVTPLGIAGDQPSRLGVLVQATLRQSICSGSAHAQQNDAGSTACVATISHEDQSFSATLLPLAARSLSITARQPALNSPRCLIMQVVTAGIFGISALQNLKASPVHICRASAEKAKDGLDDSADRETAKASTKPAWRSVREKDAVIVGSH
jgi:hypothetical protein